MLLMFILVIPIMLGVYIEWWYRGRKQDQFVASFDLLIDDLCYVDPEISPAEEAWFKLKHFGQPQQMYWR